MAKMQQMLVLKTALLLIFRASLTPAFPIRRQRLPRVGHHGCRHKQRRKLTLGQTTRWTIVGALRYRSENTQAMGAINCAQ
ncbi:hypothetical protein LguiA_004772 [Lonicera macranthoides]